MERIERFLEKVNRELIFIFNGLRGGFKIVGSVALILQAILALQSTELSPELRQRLELLVLEYITQIDDYDIVIYSTNDTDLTQNYTILNNKGFIKESTDPDSMPSIEDIKNGIKMICRTQTPEIKIDYIGINKSLDREKDCPIKYDSPSKYYIGDTHYIYLEKVCKLTNYKVQINNSTHNRDKKNIKKKI